MHQQLWGYKVEWKSVSRGTGGKKVEYHCSVSQYELCLHQPDAVVACSTCSFGIVARRRTRSSAVYLTNTVTDSISDSDCG
jgi:DNA-directed RNA polymerase subunit RPC12/RpoP